MLEIANRTPFNPPALSINKSTKFNIFSKAFNKSIKKASSIKSENISSIAALTLLLAAYQDSA